ncbi:hypothetical protein L345_02853, partial [Ophiophagus hannah]
MTLGIDVLTKQLVGCLCAAKHRVSKSAPRPSEGFTGKETQENSYDSMQSVMNNAKHTLSQCKPVSHVSIQSRQQTGTKKTAMLSQCTLRANYNCILHCSPPHPQAKFWWILVSSSPTPRLYTISDDQNTLPGGLQLTSSLTSIPRHRRVGHHLPEQQVTHSVVGADTSASKGPSGCIPTASIPFLTTPLGGASVCGSSALGYFRPARASGRLCLFLGPPRPASFSEGRQTVAKFGSTRRVVGAAAKVLWLSETASRLRR